MSAKAAHGTTLTRGNAASPEVFTAVGSITDISIDGVDMNIIEVLTHDVDYIQKLASHLNNGQVSLTVAYDDADTSHDGMEDDHDAKTYRNFKITMTNGRVFAFGAFVKTIRYNMSPSGINEGTFTLEVGQTWTRS